MNNAVNNKRVFLVTPHVPIGYLDIVGRRGDVRLDQLENGSPTVAAKSVLAAAHAYQTSSARDELARDLHTGAELLAHTPNLLLVSTNGAGYDTVDVKACTERSARSHSPMRLISVSIMPTTCSATASALPPD